MYLYGANGHAKVIIDILKSRDIVIDGLVDDDIYIDNLVDYQVVHTMDNVKDMIISIGDNCTRKVISEKYSGLVKYKTAVHKSSIISDYSNIGEGSVVMQGAIVQSCTNIGSHCIINTGSLIDHDCIIENYAHISPHATICENVVIGEGACIGAGSIIVQGVKIGKWCIIGDGSVVTKDVPDNVLAVGNRCKLVKNLEDNKLIGRSRDIAIYGIGGFGREVLTLISDINANFKQYNFIGFFVDDVKAKGEKINGYDVLGGIKEINDYKGELLLVLAVGLPSSKKVLFDKIENNNISYPILVHPSVIIDDERYVNIGRGAIICADVILTCNIEIDDFTTLNLRCTVGHDTKIGKFSSFMPSVNISGWVNVGEYVYVGTGAKIIDHLEIGENTIIGAGAVVSRSIPANCTAVGIPAKPIKFH